LFFDYTTFLDEEKKTFVADFDHRIEEESLSLANLQKKIVQSANLIPETRAILDLNSDLPKNSNPSIFLKTLNFFFFQKSLKIKA
jgi:hypothetical protein